jgi:hypothetical protein
VTIRTPALSSKSMLAKADRFKRARNLTWAVRKLTGSDSVFGACDASGLVTTSVLISLRCFGGVRLRDQALATLRGQIIEIISGTVFVFLGLAACGIAAMRRRSGVRVFVWPGIWERDVRSPSPDGSTGCRSAFT